MEVVSYISVKCSLVGLGLVASKRVAEKGVAVSLPFVRAKHCFVPVVHNSGIEAMVLVLVVWVRAGGARVIIPVEADILACSQRLPR